MHFSVCFDFLFSFAVSDFVSVSGFNGWQTRVDQVQMKLTKGGYRAAVTMTLRISQVYSLRKRPKACWTMPLEEEAAPFDHERHEQLQRAMAPFQLTTTIEYQHEELDRAQKTAVTRATIELFRSVALYRKLLRDGRGALWVQQCVVPIDRLLGELRAVQVDPPTEPDHDMLKQHVLDQDEIEQTALIEQRKRKRAED